MENENFDSEEIVQELIMILSEYEFSDIVAEIEERIKFNFKEKEQLNWSPHSRLIFYLQQTIEILKNESGHLPKEVIIPNLNEYLKGPSKIESIVVDFNPEEKILYGRDDFDLGNLPDYRNLISDLQGLLKEINPR